MNRQAVSVEKGFQGTARFIYNLGNKSSPLRPDSFPQDSIYSFLGESPWLNYFPLGPTS
jgi:hypothetical protein